MKDVARRALQALGWALALALAGCGGGSPADTGVTALRKADLAAFTGHGTWWNPSEPGTGFFFEAQGGVGVVTFYLFDTQGRPVWYSAAGAFTSPDSGYRFEGTLQRYSGGQALGAPYVRGPVATPVGAVSIRFDGDSAQVTLPRRSFTARKFWTAAPPVAGVQPETGIYWDPNQSGRGYTVETMGSTVSLTMFHYDAQGEPTWNLAVGPLQAGTWSATFLRYSGGQTLDGPYVPAAQPLQEGVLSGAFTQPCSANLWLPSLGTLPVRRFAFGTLPAGSECRSGTRTAAQGAAVASQQVAITGGGAGLVRPAAVAIDAAGVAYVADEGAHAIFRITSDGAATVLAGRVGDLGYLNGKGSGTRFNGPTGITIDAAGVLYVSDTGNNAIRRIATDGTVTTLAGLPGQTTAVNGPLAAARFDRPGRLRADAQGNLYIAEGATVRRIGTDGQVTTFAGAFAVSRRFLADAAQAGFYSVQSVAIDSQGNVWVLEVDTGGQPWIRRFDASGRIVALPNSADGTWPVLLATDLALDSSGNVYVPVAGSTGSGMSVQGVYKIDPSGAMTLYGGAAQPGYAVPSTFPRLMGGASGIALDPSAPGGTRALVTDRTSVLLWQLRP